MSRCRALLCFLGLLGLMIGYGVWCGRYLYLKPRLEMHGGHTEDVKRAVTRWYRDARDLDKRGFRWDEYWAALRHPWQDYRPRLNVVVIPAFQGRWGGASNESPSGTGSIEPSVQDLLFVTAAFDQCYWLFTKIPEDSDWEYAGKHKDQIRY